MLSRGPRLNDLLLRWNNLEAGRPGGRLVVGICRLATGEQSPIIPSKTFRSLVPRVLSALVCETARQRSKFQPVGRKS